MNFIARAFSSRGRIFSIRSILCLSGAPSCIEILPIVYRELNRLLRCDRPAYIYSQSEEEALTARIIHYFSLGVLQLPEGTTLRAYLAQKLDCDPMRITKKFTGTNCLGKRVYHSCERTTATYEVAKQAIEELAELESRFRARLERNKEKRTGILDIEVCGEESATVQMGLSLLCAGTRKSSFNDNKKTNSANS